MSVHGRASARRAGGAIHEGRWSRGQTVIVEARTQRTLVRILLNDDGSAIIRVDRDGEPRTRLEYPAEGTLADVALLGATRRDDRIARWNERAERLRHRGPDEAEAGNDELRKA